MTMDLDRQLREYCQDMDDKQGSISLNDILERTRDIQVIPPRTEKKEARPGLRVAAAMVIAVITTAVGIRLLVADATPQPVDEPTTTLPSAPFVRDALPGRSTNEPGGIYGWTGAPGSRVAMHFVVNEGHQFRHTQLVFAIGGSCFTAGGDPVELSIGGIGALSVEPYESENVTFFTRLRGGETTAAYAMPVGDRTLCAYLTRDPTTTAEEWAAGRAIVDSIRAHPDGSDGIQINFTLPPGWDTG
jgi:hypothetical protein